MIQAVILCAAFCLGGAAFECAASGYETAAFACAVAFAAIVFGFVAWLLWFARDTLAGSTDE